jgi:hypothetical protein
MPEVVAEFHDTYRNRGNPVIQPQTRCDNTRGHHRIMAWPCTPPRPANDPPSGRLPSGPALPRPPSQPSSPRSQNASRLCRVPGARPNPGARVRPGCCVRCRLAGRGFGAAHCRRGPG